MPSAGESGWLLSSLNPYPPGSFFTAADAASFARAIEEHVSMDSGVHDCLEPGILRRLATLFESGPILILSEPPRKTAHTGPAEAMYVYSCPTCGFLRHGSWVFDTNELSRDEIRSSVEAMLKYTYCPICSSKDIVSVCFVLGPFDPDRDPDFMSGHEDGSRSAG